jgi:2-succinyl-5-enolpyruvyl-6-hydroxy-3-cyclohexene-1-carboxylate synthase
MKQLINRNTLWCSVFAGKLSKLGVKYVCISPGSRSTPLSLAFSTSKTFKVYPIVDERSSAFFALGLAKKSNIPVALVTTSGTAVAELYPAIIEAYFQRIPLIVCTADRPFYLQKSGANQTINQNNIFVNHIRYFANISLPSLRPKKIKKLIDITFAAVNTAIQTDKGPVHLNFPFEKPFEPDTPTDFLDKKLLKSFTDYVPNFSSRSNINKKEISFIIKTISEYRKGIIFCGYNNYSHHFADLILMLSKKSGYPIWADGSSGLRFTNSTFHENYNVLIRSKKFLELFNPEVIIQFGGAPTSNAMLEFYKATNAEKIIVNKFGDRNDPSLTAKTIIKMNPDDFCNKIISLFDHDINPKWFRNLKTLNSQAEKSKQVFLKNAPFNFEGKIINEVVKISPSKSNLMISNSLPIRDADFFISSNSKKINLFTNRGASGIDGINSTALGIASLSKKPTILITGDLAFFHDLTGLHNSIKFNIPLTIVLINNHGGGIFQSLPIARFGKIFKEYFLTDLKLDNKRLVKAFGGYYNKVSNLNQLKNEIELSFTRNSLSVIEIFTDAKESKLLRDKYWNLGVKSIEKQINAFKDK